VDARQDVGRREVHPRVRIDPTPAACTHLDQITTIELPPTIAGCEECLKTGDRWVHLRMCTSCGTIRCCDSSPNRHARAHAAESGHEIIRSAEPGEDWVYCFVDDVAWEA
jgi:uncharacterized UBP type Zn finger protein